MVEDIIAYSKVLEKCYEQVNICKKGEKIKPIFKKTVNRISLKSKFKKKDKEKVIRQVKHYAKEISKFIIILKLRNQKNKKENVENGAVQIESPVPIYDVIRKNTIKVTYQDTLNPKIFPWNKIIIEGLTTKEIYRLYKDMIPNEYKFSKKILNKPHKNKGDQKIINICEGNGQIRVEKYSDDEQLYCYCKKKYGEELMVGCNGENCPYGGWIHPFCEVRLMGLTKKELDEIEFLCKDCMESRENVIPSVEVQVQNEILMEDTKPEVVEEIVEPKVEENSDEIGGEVVYLGMKGDIMCYSLKDNEITPQKPNKSNDDGENNPYNACEEN